MRHGILPAMLAVVMLVIILMYTTMLYQQSLVADMKVPRPLMVELEVEDTADLLRGDEEATILDWRSIITRQKDEIAFQRILQLDNDIELLDLMQSDAEHSNDPRFVLTPYWREYSARVRVAVVKNTLINYRAPHGWDDSGQHFGALVKRQDRNTIRQCVAQIERIARAVEQKYPTRTPPLLLLKASAAGAAPMATVNNISTWLGESYSDVVQKVRFHNLFLNAYQRLVEAIGADIPFHELEHFVELGAGVGQQVEVVAQAFPHMAIYTFDLPTQNYIANRFLSKTFPSRFVSYARNRLGPVFLPPGGISSYVNYRIVDLAVDGSKTVFWNAASFEEMPLAIVKSYLDIVIQKRIRFVYLWEWTVPHPKGGGHDEYTGTDRLGSFAEYDKYLQLGGYTKLKQEVVDFFRCSRAPTNVFTYATWVRNKNFPG